MAAYDISEILNAGGDSYILKDAKVRAAVAEMINRGHKNELVMTQTSTTITRYGVTATYNKTAGTITLNGTHKSTDSAAIFELYSGSGQAQRNIPPGTYRLSGTPAGGSTNTYRAALHGISAAVDVGEGATFTLNSATYGAYRILVSGDVSFSNAVFRPMCCLEAYYKVTPDFVTYFPSDQDLYAMIQELQQQIQTE